MENHVFDRFFRKKWVRFLFAILFFAGVPIGLLNLGWYFMDTQEYNRLVQENYRELDQTLFRLKREADDAAFLNKRLNELSGLLLEDLISSTTIELAIQQFERSKLPFMTFYFFDARGEIMPFRGQKNEYRSIIKKIYAALREYEVYGKTDLMKQYRSMFHAFLGNYDPERVYSEKGNLFRVKLKGTMGFFYWNSFERAQDVPEGKRTPVSLKDNDIVQGGVIAFCEENAVPKFLSLNRLIKTLNHNKNRSLYGLMNFEVPDFSVPSPAELKKRRGLPRIPEVVRRLRSRFQKRETLPGGLMSILPLDGEHVLYAIRSTAVFRQGRIGTSVFLLSLLLVLFTAIWAYRLLYSDRVIYIPIRNKLVALFLYATAVPVISFILLGYQYVSDRRQVMFQEQFRKLAGFNETIDENFDIAKLALQNYFKRLAGSWAVRELSAPRLNRIMKHMKKHRLLPPLYIVNGEGVLLFSSEERDQFKGIAGKLIPAMARKVFSRKYGESLSNLKTKMSDAMVDSFTDTVSEFFAGSGSNKFLADVMEQTNKLQEFQFGNTANLLFTSFFDQARTAESLFLIVFQRKVRLADRYLQIILANNHRQNETRHPIRVVYFENTRPFHLHPRGYSKYPFLKEVFEKVRTSQAQNASIEEMGGESYLVMASPMNKLAEYILIALYPRRLIEETLRGISLKIGGVALISGIFAFFIGVLLAREFLWPIQELRHGIQAIEARDLGYRIPSMGRDEFGDLGAMFNRVIESLEELHIGKIVQETLFPADSFNAGEFEIHGTSRAMTDLGGDYYDYFPLDDRFAVVLIGDVTGHGVPAALIMAMAKSVVKTCSKEEAVQVELVLGRLNLLFLETMKKKRLMTFFYAILDLQEHVMIGANAGHNYPCFYEAGSDTARLVECAGFPLGARKKGTYQPLTFPFAPGDTMLLYTDGIVESKNPQDENIGYPRLEQFLARACRQSGDVRQIRAHISQAMETFLAGAPLLDDVTFIVIRRKDASPPA
jgi:HAMP domain-containing protein